MSDILTMTNPEISSVMDVSIFINLCSLGYSITCSFEKHGIDLCRKLKHDSLKLIIPSNLNIFFIPETKSILSCISETNVNISNLWPCISLITGIINKTLTHCPFPAWISEFWMKISVTNVMTYISNNAFWHEWFTCSYI